jgi:hypothetical protein
LLAWDVACGYGVPTCKGGHGVGPGATGIERWHKSQCLAARRTELLSPSDADLLERLKTIGNEGRAKHE